MFVLLTAELDLPTADTINEVDSCPGSFIFD